MQGVPSDMALVDCKLKVFIPVVLDSFNKINNIHGGAHNACVFVYGEMVFNRGSYQAQTSQP